MKPSDWAILTRELIGKYVDCCRIVMAAFDVLKEHGIPVETVGARSKSEPFASMVHPAITALINALNKEDQEEAERALRNMKVTRKPN